MTHSASAGFEQTGSTHKRGCGFSSMGRWSAWEIGAMVAAVGWTFGARVVCLGREGSTARARAAGVEMPVTEAMVALLEGRVTAPQVVELLMGRQAQTRR